MNISDDQKKLQNLNKAEREADKRKIIESLEDDYLKLKITKAFIKDKTDKAGIIATLKDDNIKLKILDNSRWDNIIDEDCKVIIITSLKDDNKKIEYLNKPHFLPHEICRAKVIASLKIDDTEKMLYLKDFTEDVAKAVIIGGLNNIDIHNSLDNMTERFKKKIWDSYELDYDVQKLILLNLNDGICRISFYGMPKQEELMNLRFMFNKQQGRQLLNETSSPKTKKIIKTAWESVKTETIADLDIDDIQKLILAKSFISEKSNKAKITASLKDDDRKLKILNNTKWDFSVDIPDIALILASLKDDDKKLEYLSSIKNEDIKTQIIANLENKDKEINSNDNIRVVR